MLDLYNPILEIDFFFLWEPSSKWFKFWSLTLTG